MLRPIQVSPGLTDSFFCSVIPTMHISMLVKPCMDRSGMHTSILDSEMEKKRNFSNDFAATSVFSLLSMQAERNSECLQFLELAPLIMAHNKQARMGRAMAHTSLVIHYGANGTRDTGWEGGGGKEWIRGPTRNGSRPVFFQGTHLHTQTIAQSHRCMCPTLSLTSLHVMLVLVMLSTLILFFFS